MAIDYLPIKNRVEFVCHNYIICLQIYQTETFRKFSKYLTMAVALAACSLVCAAVFLLAFSLPLPIVNMVYAIRDEDEMCNKDHHSMGLSLTDVLYWLAIAQFITIGIILVLLSFILSVVACCRNVGGAISAGVVSGITAIVLICAGLFITAWTIVGFVILVTDDIDCLKDGKSIGILMLINFIFLFVELPSFGIFGVSMSATLAIDD